MTRRHMTQYEFWDQQMRLSKEIRNQANKEAVELLRKPLQIIFIIVIACITYGVLFPQ